MVWFFVGRDRIRTYQNATAHRAVAVRRLDSERSIQFANGKLAIESLIRIKKERMRVKHALFCLSAKQQSKQLIIRKSRMGIGGIQNGFHVVDAVLDFLGKQLGCAENVTA